jgi:hypothetical protein
MGENKISNYPITVDKNYIFALLKNHKINYYD